MEPITLATITAALTVLATDVISGAASAAGEDLWQKAKALLGWRAEPDLPNLAVAIAEELQRNEERAGQLVALLQEHPHVDQPGAALVSKIDAKKVIVTQRLEVQGDFNM